ncbi:MAG: L,D-transpeptidase [Bryobacteraceae bacterium]|jgi:lipoprotein-anchoring transpeptidase ErfK/SrfK
MHDTQRHCRCFKALAALCLAAGEALAQKTQPVARRLVVSIPDRKLALVEDGRVVKIYPVAVGKEATPSPAGSFTVAERVTHPTWYRPGKVVPPGRSNPLGPRWIGLSRRGYGIHGTNTPRSIGRRASHGCIRMRNADVEELFAWVAIGDPVELFAERTAEVTAIFGGPAAGQVAVSARTLAAGMQAGQ